MELFKVRSEMESQRFQCQVFVQHGSWQIISEIFEMTIGEIKTKWIIKLHPAGDDGDRDSSAFAFSNWKNRHRILSFPIALFIVIYRYVNRTEEVYYKQFDKFKKSGEIETCEVWGLGDIISHKDFFKRHDELTSNSALSFDIK
jgi:hypothetical protein